MQQLGNFSSSQCSPWLRLRLSTKVSCLGKFSRCRVQRVIGFFRAWIFLIVLYLNGNSKFILSRFAGGQQRADSAPGRIWNVTTDFRFCNELLCFFHCVLIPCLPWWSSEALHQGVRSVTTERSWCRASLGWHQGLGTLTRQVKPCTAIGSVGTFSYPFLLNISQNWDWPINISK